MDNVLGNLQFPLLPLWEVLRHTVLVCLLPICLFNLFIKHSEPHGSLKKHILWDAGKPRLQAVLRVGRAGNCPTESRGAAFLQHKHIWRSRRGRRKVGEENKDENIGISNINATKILQQDRGCPKGGQFLGEYSILRQNGAGNIHKCLCSKFLVHFPSLAGTVTCFVCLQLLPFVELEIL